MRAEWQALDKYDPIYDVIREREALTLKLIEFLGMLCPQSLLSLCWKRLDFMSNLYPLQRDVMRYGGIQTPCSRSPSNEVVLLSQEGWRSSGLYQKIIDNIKLEIRDVRVEYENSFKLNLRIASLTL